MIKSIFHIFLAVCASPVFLAWAQDAPTSPVQPLTGPGSKEYKCSEVVKSIYGKGETQYWIFEPSNPKPVQAPLIVFNHGWSAMKPQIYGKWIGHIVRRGNIVVFPRYQSNLFTSPKKFTFHAIESIKSAIEILNQEGHVKPDLEKFAVVGHSVGGLITANIACLAQKEGIPKPRAVMCVQPGKTRGVPKSISFPLENLNQIPADTLLLTVAGDKDKLVKDVDARRIFMETTSIPWKNKNFVMMVSDFHGNPPLIADHRCPTSYDDEYAWEPQDEEKEEEGDEEEEETEKWYKKKIWKKFSLTSFRYKWEHKLGKHYANAFDYYGLWKLWDGLCDMAFYGVHGEYALGNTPQQRFMGKWSDGVLVKEMIVTEKP